MNRTSAAAISRPSAALVAALAALTAVGTACSAQAQRSEKTPKLGFDRPAAASDPFNDPRGPYFHDVYRASSSDGLAFGAPVGPVIEKMSVPDVIRLPSGRLLMYGVDGAGRSKSGLTVALSDDSGRKWRRGSVRLETSRNPGIGADPDVVRLANGKLRLYYMVPGGPPPTPGSPPGEGQRGKILSATGRDGVHFKEDSGTRFDPGRLITDPDVVKIGRRWFMYYSEGERLQAACSANGTSFTPCGTVRDRGSVSTTVQIGQRRWRQFFCREGIASAVTSDGLRFTDDPGTRATIPDRIVCDPAPVRIPRRGSGSTWSLWLKVGPALPPPPAPPNA